jgi:hypothetical protein
MLEKKYRKKELFFDEKVMEGKGKRKRLNKEM